MHLCGVLAFALCVIPLAQALFQGYGDGVYRGYYDSDGNHAMEKIAEIEPMPKLPRRNAPITRDVASPANLFDKRTGVHVCLRVTLSRNDVGQATYNLGRTCDAGAHVKAHNFIAAITGDAIVYLCNNNNEGRLCDSGNVNFYVNGVEKDCPVVRGGWLVFRNLKICGGYASTSNGICTPFPKMPHGPPKSIASSQGGTNGQSGAESADGKVGSGGGGDSSVSSSVWAPSSDSGSQSGSSGQSSS